MWIVLSCFRLVVRAFVSLILAHKTASQQLLMTWKTDCSRVRSVLLEFSKPAGLCDNHWCIGYICRLFKKCKNPLGCAFLSWQHGARGSFGSLGTVCSSWECDHMQEPESAKGTSHEQSYWIQQGRKQESCVNGMLYILICLSLHLRFHFSSWLNPGKISSKIPSLFLTNWQIPFNWLDRIFYLNLRVMIYL